MSIKKRGNVWWYFFTIEGKRYRGSCNTANEKEAREFHDRLRADLWRTGTLKEKPRRTWREALERWLGEHQHKRTIEADHGFGDWWTAKFSKRGVKFLDEVSPDVVKAIRDEDLATPRQRDGKPKKPASVNRKIAMLRAVMNAAAREYQWLDSAPLFRCIPERNERLRFLTPPEVHRLLNALKEPYRSMAKLAVATGLRQANVLGLTWKQVDFTKRVLTFPEQVMKNGLPLSIPINQTALDAIRPWVGKDMTHVFVKEDGLPAREVPSKMWSKALRDAGLEDFKWHDLRHTWASLMRQAGLGLDVIQELGAWQDSTMVRRYAHLSIDHLSRHSTTLDGVLEPAVAQIRHSANAG